MKKLLLILLSAAALIFVSCDKDDDTKPFTKREVEKPDTVERNTVNGWLKSVSGNDSITFDDFVSIVISGILTTPIARNTINDIDSIKSKIVDIESNIPKKLVKIENYACEIVYRYYNGSDPVNSTSSTIIYGGSNGNIVSGNIYYGTVTVTYDANGIETWLWVSNITDANSTESGVSTLVFKKQSGIVIDSSQPSTGVYFYNFMNTPTTVYTYK